MRNREFIIRHGNGAPDDVCEGTIYDILYAIPYLTIDHYVLPKIVVDSILAKGLVDAGQSGGCEWQASKFDQTEYEQLEQRFIENGFVPIEVPDWVVDRDTWQVLMFEVKYGMPHAEHLELNRRTRILEDKLERARTENNEEQEGQCMLELVQISSEWNDLFDSCKNR